MKIHITDGAKGGVGKSQTAQILINYLSRNDKLVIVFETDTQIPDVARCVQETERNIKRYLLDIRTDEGWQTMLEILQNLAFDDATKDANIVLSLPGADLDIPSYTELVADLSNTLNIEVWDWFVLNVQSDSVELLSESLKTGFASIATKRIAVKNGFFGKPESFIAFDSSKLLKSLNNVVYIEKLSTEPAKKLRNETVLIDEAAEIAKKGKDGKRPDILYSSNLTRWVKRIDDELDRVFALPTRSINHEQG